MGQGGCDREVGESEAGKTGGCCGGCDREVGRGEWGRQDRWVLWGV